MQLTDKLLGVFRRKKEKEPEYVYHPKPRTTAFLKEVNNAIDYASEKKSEFTLVLVDFREEYAVKEFKEILMYGFHANNGFVPSNELRQIGKGQIGAVVHIPEERVGYMLEELVRKFVTVVPNNKDTALKIGITSYREGDDVSSMLVRAQNQYVDFLINYAKNSNN